MGGGGSWPRRTAAHVPPGLIAASLPLAKVRTAPRNLISIVLEEAAVSIGGKKFNDDF